MRFLLSFFILCSFFANAQTSTLKGIVTSSGKPQSYASVSLKGTKYGIVTNSEGTFLFNNVDTGTYEVIVQLLGYETEIRTIKLQKDTVSLQVELRTSTQTIESVVISGTLKEVSKSESPVPVEVYSESFFKKNPTPSIFEAMSNINGVRPQLNCNVCNTGDIHINGLEGPYTMILIDGMPIVSGLSTVYGLMGIPQALIERVEVVKGPASTLYGSEAVGGIINVITKSTEKSAKFSADVNGSSWGEINTDVGLKFNAGKKASSLLGVNYFNFQNRVDNNGDNFTDVTLQDRVSIFNKWSFKRKKNRVFTLAGRYMYEDRWGGELDWEPKFRGGNQVYGESIYTNRWEAFGLYQLPTKEKIDLSFSANQHLQNSVYGDLIYIGEQSIFFSQLTWFKTIRRHSLTAGLAYRFTYYDDNTVATLLEPSRIHLPGLFIQDEIAIGKRSKLLLGGRYDYNSNHGNVFSPRINYKWSSKNKKNILRLSAGNGFRVANVFTEDHAALTGAREVVFDGELNPETSWNVNLNYVKKFIFKNDAFLSVDATAFYTYFDNRIVPDYETDPSKIIYANLEGFAVSQGISVNTDFSMPNGFNLLAGVTLMDVSITENGVREQQILTERITGTWGISYNWKKYKLKFDYTGNLYGPMRLPLLGELDPRAPTSPYWSLQNVQVTKGISSSWEVYGSVKNLLNYTPPANSIWGAHDPFDRVDNDTQDPDNLGFDPSYMFAPNQGIRLLIGVRYSLK